MNHYLRAARLAPTPGHLPSASRLPPLAGEDYYILAIVNTFPSLVGQGGSPATRRAQISTVKGLTAWMVRRGDLTAGPGRSDPKRRPQTDFG